VQPPLSWIFLRKRKQARAAFSLGVFLLLQAMVVFPGLHSLIHADAADRDHVCAVTLFTHGQVHCPDAAVPVVRPLPLRDFIQFCQASVLVPTDVRLLPVRGPPARPSFLS
jgi:hypothetical protein